MQKTNKINAFGDSVTGRQGIVAYENVPDKLPGRKDPRTFIGWALKAFID